jgi:hypothetical protein
VARQMLDVRNRGPLTKALSSVLVVGVAGLLLAGTFSVLSGSTTNSGNALTTGSVSVGDNSGGVAMYTDTGLGLGDSVSRCIQVTYTGTSSAAMNLYVPETLDQLAPYADLTVDEFSGSSSAFPDCSGVNGNSQNMYSGTLADFQANHNSYGNGLAVYPTPWFGASSWAQNDSVVFRFTLTIDGSTPVSTPLTTGSHSWVWEAQG